MRWWSMRRSLERSELYFRICYATGNALEACLEDVCHGDCDPHCAQQDVERPSGSVAFEAVSIKPADPADPMHMTHATPGGLRGRNLRLFELIMGAWHLNHDQIIGSTGWMETTGWDIEARFPEGASSAQAPQMMQAMLADRFRLVIHRETRTLPVYALSVANGGVKLHQGDGAGACPRGRARSVIAPGQ
jgi:uncharacterized protein (TIGR03435 family)